MQFHCQQKPPIRQIFFCRRPFVVICHPNITVANDKSGVSQSICCAQTAVEMSVVCEMSQICGRIDDAETCAGPTDIRHVQRCVAIGMHFYARIRLVGFCKPSVFPNIEETVCIVHAEVLNSLARSPQRFNACSVKKHDIIQFAYRCCVGQGRVAYIPRPLPPWLPPPWLLSPP